MHRQFVDVLVPILADKGEVRILDVAAASGEPSLSLAKALPNASIIATDIAETYLPLGQARAEAAGIYNVKFEAADGENLSQFADASYDVVTCSLGLMFFPNEKKGLAEFYRVLKPGGILGVTVWSDKVPFFTAASDVAKQIAVQQQTEGAPLPTINMAMRFGDGQGLVETIKGAGFVDTTHQEIDVTFGLAGVDEQGWFGQLWKTPFPLKAAVMQAIAAGNANAKEEAKEKLEAAYREKGFITSIGALAASGNFCHFILAHKAWVRLECKWISAYLSYFMESFGVLKAVYTF